MSSRDLKWARSYLREMEKQAIAPSPDQYKVNQEAHSTFNAILNHLEARQKTPASETSSALTTGLVIKRYGSAIASLDTSRGQFHLTVETGDSSKSISFTSEEWAAIRQHFSIPWSTSVSPTAFIGRPAAGGRGVAVPDSPASSPEPAQGGSEKCEHPQGMMRRLQERGDYGASYTSDWEWCQQCGNLRDTVSGIWLERFTLTNHEGRE